MAVSYFVRYEGRAEDHEAFVGYYRSTHAAILRRFPGIRKLILHVPQEWSDPCPVRKGNFALLAQMVVDSAADLQAALESRERREARGDFSNFPAFHGEIFHQAMASEEVYSGD